MSIQCSSIIVSSQLCVHLYSCFQVYYRHNVVQQMKTLHLSVFCPELLPETEPSQEPATVKSGKKGEGKSAGNAKDKSGKDKEKKAAMQQKAKEEHVEVQQTGEELSPSVN